MAVDELADSYTEDRYPGFDLEEEDWGLPCTCLAAVTIYVTRVGNTL